jgi:hypothetical protein
MRLPFLLILSFYCTTAKAQKYTFDKYEQDTLYFSNSISFKKTVELHLSEAIISIDFNYFKEKLKLERKGCRKQIRQRERVPENSITANQLKTYRKQYIALDSIYNYLTKSGRQDTASHVNYNVFLKVNSPFGDFLLVLIENGLCVIKDENNKRQNYIIRQIG